MPVYGGVSSDPEGGQMTDIEKPKSLFLGLLSSLFASVIVGAFASYMTGNVMLAKLETRLARAEADITSVNVNVRALEAQRSSDREAMIRLEAKIDLILQKQMYNQQVTFPSVRP